jgi:hypothetical protein
VGQHEHRVVERWVFPLPPTPLGVSPRTSDRTEHVAAHDCCSDPVAPEAGSDPYPFAGSVSPEWGRIERDTQPATAASGSSSEYVSVEFRGARTHPAL